MLIRGLPGTALVLLVAASSGCPADGPTDIAVHNVSEHDYVSVSIASVDYGDIAAGAVAGPHSHEIAYRYNQVHLTIDGDEYILQPIDYVGETPLGPGCFVYAVDVLSVDDRSLSIEVEDGASCPGE